jgi:hypothetical protein
VAIPQLFLISANKSRVLRVWGWHEEECKVRSEPTFLFFVVSLAIFEERQPMAGVFAFVLFIL